MNKHNRREKLIAGFRKKITEDDPRWKQQLAHGQGQERKVGANVTIPRAYVSGGSRRGRRSRGT